MAVTWSPSDKNSAIALSNGNLTATNTVTDWRSVRANISKSSGKWYFECRSDSGGDQMVIGLANISQSLSTYIANSSNSWAVQISGDGVLKRYWNSTVTYSGVVHAIGDVYMLAWDASSGKLWFGRNGVWLDGGDPGNGANAAYSGVTGTLYPACSCYSPSDIITARFKNTNLSYSPPNGFSALEIEQIKLPRIIQINSPYQHSLVAARLGL